MYSIMSNVVKLVPRSKQAIKVNKDVINELENLLKFAKQGKIQNIISIYVSDKDEIDYSEAGIIEPYSLSYIGMIENIKIDLK